MKSKLIEQVKPMVAVLPVDVSATLTAQAGISIDRKGYLNAILQISLGAITGTGAYSDFVVQTDDNSNFTSPTTLQTITTFPTLQNTSSYIQVPLANAERYIRVLYTLTIGGGGATAHAMTILLGDKDILPV